MVTLESDYFTTFSNAFRDRFITAGSISYDQLVDLQVTDLKTVAARVKSARPDVVLANLGPNQLPKFLQELKRLGVQSRVFSNFLVGMKDIRSASGGAATGAQYIASTVDIVQFKEQFQKLSGGLEPSSLGYSCFLSAYLALQTVDKLGPNISRETVSQALLQTRKFSVLGKDFEIVNRELVLKPRVVTVDG